MQKSPSEDERANYHNDAKIMMKIARRKIKEFFADEPSRLNLTRTKAEVQAKKIEAIVDVPHIGSNSVSNGIKPVAEFPKTTMIELFSRGAADDVILKCLERWSKSDAFMDGILKRIVFISMSRRQGPGLSNKNWTHPATNIA